MFWIFKKNEYFLGYDEIVDNFWGHPITGLFSGVIYICFRAFSSGQGRKLEYFGGVAKFEIFFVVCLIFRTDIF